MPRNAFIILEVAADWHELMMLQHIVQSSIAHASGKIGPGDQAAACRHTTTPTNNTRP